MSDRLAELKQKYQSVLKVIEQQQVRLKNVHVENNKLLIRGEASSQDAKNKVWDQIKLLDPNHLDLTADITVATPPGASVFGPTQSSGNSYVVQAGDTLSAISKKFYGDANQYMRIFNANRDKLKDPDKIQVGQQLTIPSG